MSQRRGQNPEPWSWELGSVRVVSAWGNRTQGVNVDCLFQSGSRPFLLRLQAWTPHRQMGSQDQGQRQGESCTASWYFFLMSPLQSTNVMDKGQTHYSWVSICLVQMQRLTRETSSKGQCPGLCAPRLMYVRHTQGSSLQHLSPKAKANHGGF